MMRAPRPHPDMDAYLDGALDAARREAFERELAADETLRADVELQRAINASLGRLFAYPSEDAASDGPAPMPMGRRGSRRWGLLGVAAALLAGVSVFLLRPAPSDGVKHQSPTAFYATVERGGWKPSWACETEEQFARAIANQFQLVESSLLVPFATPGVRLDGWAFANGYREGTPLGPRSLVLLAHADDRRVLVVMDTLGNDRKLSLPSRSELKLFRREAAGLVMYEITPLGTPRVLDAAVAVPVPARKPVGGPADGPAGPG